MRKIVVLVQVEHRVFKRFIQYTNHERPDMREGCEDRFGLNIFRGINVTDDCGFICGSFFILERTFKIVYQQITI